MRMSGELRKLIPVVRRNAFMLFAITTLVIAASIVLLNTYSPLQGHYALLDAEANSKELASSLYDIQEHYAESARSMTQFLPETDDPLKDDGFLQRLAGSVNAVSTDFARQRELVLGYFFFFNAQRHAVDYEVFHNIWSDKVSHISMILGYMTDEERLALENEISRTGSPVWTTVNQPMTNKYYLTCVIPLFYNETYLGFAGIVVDSGTLKSMYDGLQSTKWKNSFLVTPKNEIFAHDTLPGGERLEFAEQKKFEVLAEAMKISERGSVLIREPADSRIWIYAFDKMPSGHTYVETRQRRHAVQSVNLLILQTALMAVIATSLVQEHRGGGSYFDRISRRLLVYPSETHPIKANASRAVLALNIGCIGGICSHLIYLLQSGGSVSQIMFLVFVLVLLTAVLFTYRVKEISARKLIIAGTLALVLPVVLQIMDKSANGNSLVWILAAIVGTLFLFELKDAHNVFYAFVIVLLLYVLFEIFVFKNLQPQYLIPVIGSLFFLGFALFASIGVYVQSSKNDYIVLEDTLTQLKNAESMLVQHEKMVMLGQLVAGIAHEINTPLGAIKASAETINDCMDRVFRLLMEHGGSFGEDEIGDFLRLTDIVTVSIKEMNTTAQARKARPEIKEFVQGLFLEPEIADMLIRLEIANVNLLRENVDVFENPKIGEMLQLLCDVVPLISGGQTIQFAGEKAGKIVFALKSYAHTGVSGEFAQFDVEKSIENVLLLHYNQLKQGINLIKEYDENIPMITGNVDEIGQVWTNLIQNAIQAMPCGGELTIRLKNAKDGFVEAHFADTGCGISSDNINKIFEPFFTTKPLGEGSGLGLDISNKIVHRHGGEIRAENRQQGGTVFIVKLPVDIWERENNIK